MVCEKGGLMCFREHRSPCRHAPICSDCQPQIESDRPSKDAYLVVERAVDSVLFSTAVTGIRQFSSTHYPLGGTHKIFAR